MKQINDYKKKNLELRENCILERIAYFLLNNNYSLNRNIQKKQVSSNVFFITLIVIYLSPCFVNAYAGNDAVYTIPSKHLSKQVIQIVHFLFLNNVPLTSRNIFHFFFIHFSFEHQTAIFYVQFPR